MDNLSQKITNTIENSSVPSYTSEVSTSTNLSFIDSIRSISITTWIIIILLLAFLGFNVFTYLAKGTQTIADIFAPITNTTARLFGKTASQVVNVSAEGAKEVVSTTANVAETGLTSIQNIATGGILSSNSKSSINQTNIKASIPQPDISQNNSFNKALNTTVPQKQKIQDYEADQSSSSVQMRNKAGWCYVGENNGLRTCAEVGVNDTCMSGEIFPTRDICVNPKLRTQ